MSKGKTFWDRFAFAYDFAESFNKKVYNAMVERVADLTPNNAIVLECAAGTGAISIGISKKARQILCTDLSLPMLQKAREKAKRKGILNIRFDKRNLMNLSDADESYDMVIAANVIHLLDNPQKAMNELWRVTKKNGLLVIPTFLTNDKNKHFGFLLVLYRLIGFEPKVSFSFNSYSEFMRNNILPAKPDMELIQGSLPAGIAVFKKR